MRKTFSPGLAGLAIIIIAIGSYVIVAQNTVNGTWKATIKEGETGKIQISFRGDQDRGKMANGSSFDIAELSGLTLEDTRGGKASFRLVREAGSIDFDGAFTAGVGSGKFAFEPNRAFVDAMRTRGFDLEDRSSKRGEPGDNLFAAALINVTTALADDLVAGDLDRLDVDDLFKAAIFKIDSRFISEMKATGFPNLQMEDLVKARIFKIDADYVKQVREMGLAKENFESLVRLRIFKVTPELIGMLRSEGFTDLDTEEIVKFRIFNIDRDFIRAARTGDPNISVEGLVRKKIHGGN